MFHYFVFLEIFMITNYDEFLIQTFNCFLINFYALIIMLANFVLFSF